MCILTCFFLASNGVDGVVQHPDDITVTVTEVAKTCPFLPVCGLTVIIAMSHNFIGWSVEHRIHRSQPQVDTRWDFAPVVDGLHLPVHVVIDIGMKAGVCLVPGGISACLPTGLLGLHGRAGQRILAGTRLHQLHAVFVYPLKRCNVHLALLRRIGENRRTRLGAGDITGLGLELAVDGHAVGLQLVLDLCQYLHVELTVGIVGNAERIEAGTVGAGLAAGNLALVVIDVECHVNVVHGVVLDIFLP